MSRFSVADLAIGALALISGGMLLARFVIYLFEPRDQKKRAIDEANRRHPFQGGR